MASRPAGRCAFAWRPLVLAALAAACATSEPEDPYAAIPRRSLAEARAALPAPSPAGAFVFDGVSAYGDDVITAYRIAVEPGDYLGEPAWFVLEECTESRGKTLPMTVERVASWFSADLRVLSRKRTPPATVDTHRDDVDDATWTLAGALIFLRACTAEPAAYVDAPARGEPPYCLMVSEVAADGTVQATAPTRDHYLAHVVLRRDSREIVEIRRSLGWHVMGKIVPREAMK